MKVSFCITCKNRFHQISKTLVQNILDNKNAQDVVEFVLVDFNSHDGLRNWVTTNFEQELSSGYFKYFFTEELKNWECSIAKNTSHLLATGDILVNLDCDNYTGKNGGMYVIKQFNTYGSKLLLHQARVEVGSGCYGRISMHKSYFNLIGGYNEMFNPMGFQDVDLIVRLVAIGLIYTPKQNWHFNKAIRNTKDEGLLYTDSLKSYREMNLENIKLSAVNIINSNILANSQISGSMVWAISKALHEESVIDRNLGKYVNANLGEYHIPTHADVHQLEVIFADEKDDLINELGIKGVGEIGLVGMPAAIANAVFHATGKRVNKLPIHFDELL